MTGLGWKLGPRRDERFPKIIKHKGRIARVTFFEISKQVLEPKNTRIPKKDSWQKDDRVSHDRPLRFRSGHGYANWRSWYRSRSLGICPGHPVTVMPLLDKRVKRFHSSEIIASDPDNKPNRQKPLRPVREDYCPLIRREFTAI